MTSPEDRLLIEASLEYAAEEVGDLTPLVYARLFAERPETQALFWRDKTGSIRGEMLAKVFEVILDFIGERHFAEHLIRTSALVHTEYDVPQDLFPAFFATVARTVRAAVGEGWTPAMEAAWIALLADLDCCLTSQGSAPAAT